MSREIRDGVVVKKPSSAVIKSFILKAYPIIVHSKEEFAWNIQHWAALASR